jgi:2-amino-4-hydroxy-6-hydroxymethyldihydropteridine diphosphokinase
MMACAYIALGSNLGDREAYLQRAIEQIRLIPGLRVRALSKIYETDPVGYTDQAPFLNMVCRTDLVLNPYELLESLQEIETALDRKRDIRWGPRTIDLDILLYGNERIQTPELTIPHERMFERAFVLVPLRDVYLEPVLLGLSFEERIASCPDREGIREFKPGY